VTAALKLDLSARAFVVALFATALAIAGAGWFLVIAPKHHTAATLETQIQSEKQKLSDARSALKNAKAAQRPALNAALPSELSMPQILDQLNALAVRAGVTLDTVTPAPPVAGSGYFAVPLSVVVDGRFFAVKTFLQQVRNQVSLANTKLAAAGRLFGVSSMQLNSTPPKVTATLQMTAYYYSPTAAPPAPVTSTTSSTSGS
jgi:Tfp pilus assembly protein PilO